jgi:hypothetical protein
LAPQITDECNEWTQCLLARAAFYARAMSVQHSQQRKSRAIDPAFLVMGIELGRRSNGNHRNNRRRPCLSRLQEVEEGKREVMADEDNGE